MSMKRIVMQNREEIREVVARCLVLTPEEAAERHIIRERDGWDLKYGFWPTLAGREDVNRAETEITRVLDAHIERRGVDRSVLQIDACSIGYQQLRLRSRTTRLVAGIGLWLPVKLDLTTEVE